MSEGVKGDVCPFCEMARANPAHDRERYILRRGRLNFAFLNLYPYTPGHILVASYRHVASLSGLDAPALHEMMDLAQRSESALTSVYRCEGLNMGINVGKCAGAGVAEHIHMHVLPRWTGDANFMSVAGETRVLPEDLGRTYEKLQDSFRP